MTSVFEEEVIQTGVEGTMRVLNELGMIKESIEPKSKPVTISKSRWIRAPYSGMFHPLVKNGSKVSEKDTLGFITDPYGDFKRKVKSPFDGYIFCVNTAPIVYKGDALFNLGVTNEYKEVLPEF